MSTTIIDSLVVLFGLDPAGYKKGADEVGKIDANLAGKQKSQGDKSDKAEKDRARRRSGEVKQLQRQGDELARSFRQVGLSVAGMFLGFESVTGFAKFLGGINLTEAQLGRTAANIGMGVHELNKWGNAAQLAGGKAEDAQAAFAKISEEFTTQHVTGQTGPLLTFLRARGVAVADANGKMRNQGQILEELADKTAQYGRVYQTNMFRQAGLNEGEINYLVQSKAIREEQLRLAEKNNSLTEDEVRKAQQLQQEWNNVKEEITQAGQRVLRDLTPAIMATLGAVSQIIEKLTVYKRGADDWFAGVEAKKKKAKADGDTYAFGAQWRSPGKALAEDQARFEKENPGNNKGAWENFAQGVKDAWKYGQAQSDANVDPAYKKQLLQKIAATEAQQGIPAGMLARIAERESHFRNDVISGKKKSSAGAVGLMQLMPKYFPGAGQDPERDIDTAGKELARLYKVFGDWNKAVGAYNDGEGNIKKVLAGKKKLPDETRRYIAAVGATPGASGGAGGDNSRNTTITVDAPITVHAGSADPLMVANQTGGALQRKLVVAQAFQGQS